MKAKGKNMRKLLIAVILFCAIFHLNAEYNLIKDAMLNPGNSPMPPGWLPLEQNKDIDAKNNSVRFVTNMFRGKPALEIRLKTLNNAFTAYPVKGLKPNTWYCFSVMTKSDIGRCSGKGPCIFTGQPKSPGQFRIAQVDKHFGFAGVGKNTPRWTPLKLAFRTPENPENIYVAVGLYGALGRVWFSEMKLEETSAAKAEMINREFGDKTNPVAKKHENLILNGSFEVITSPDIPDGWTNHCYAATAPNFNENFKAVTDNPFHGKICFKVNGEVNHSGMPGCRYPVAQRQPGFLSFYARSNQPDNEITVRGQIFKQTFKLGKTWKKCVVKIPKLESNNVFFKTKGTVYLDAVKLEFGDKVTAFSPNVYELFYTAKLVKPPAPPEVSLKTVSFKGKRIPWEQGMKIKNLLNDNRKPADKPTRVFLVKGLEALHVRFECRGRTNSKLVKTVKQTDGLVFGDDAVGVVVNPGYSGGMNRTYCFEVNTNGIRRDSCGNNASWNGVWDVNIKPVKDGFDAEFRIPYAGLGDGNLFSNTWQINLIRYSAAVDKEKKEVSAWFMPENWPVQDTGMAVSGFIGLAEYKVRISKPEVLLAGHRYMPEDNLFAVDFKLGFANLKSQRGRAILSMPNGNNYNAFWQSKNGVAELAFQELNKKQITDLADFQLKIYAGRKLISQKIYRRRLTIPQLLEVGQLNRNYYTTEKDGTLAVNVHASPQYIKELELVLTLIDAKGRVFDCRYPASVTRLEFPIAKLKPGLFQCRVNLVKKAGGAEIIATGTTVLRKMVPGIVDSKIDYISRMPVINGKSMILVGIQIPLPGDLKGINKGFRRIDDRLLREIAKRFNMINLVITFLPEGKYSEVVQKEHREFIAKLKKLNLFSEVWLPFANKQGKKNIRSCYLGPKKAFALWLTAVDKLKNNPNIIGWYCMDEITRPWQKSPGAKESDLQEFYWQLKAKDPYRYYVTNALYGPRNYGGLHSSDMVGGSFYTITGYPPRGGVAGVRGYMKGIEAERSRLKIPAVTTGFLYCYIRNFQRAPSVAENRVSVFEMLINGARRIAYYRYKPLNIKLWDSFIDIKKLVEFLSPVFTGKEITPNAACSNTYVDFALWKYQNKYYLLACNYTPFAVKATFDLTMLGKVTEIKTVFSKANHNGVRIFTDNFAPYGTKVYEIE